MFCLVKGVCYLFAECRDTQKKKGGPDQSLNNEPNIICLGLSELVMLNQLVKARAKMLEKTKSKRSHHAETD
jgi:hypothetical protein